MKITSNAMERIIELCNNRRYVELRDECLQALRTCSIGSELLNINYYLYIAYYYLHDWEGVKITVQEICDLINGKEEAKREFEQRREFYLSNFDYIKHLYGGINPLLSGINNTHGKKIIGSLCGGLGNQLFIIAKTLYEAERVGATFHVTLDHYGKGQGNCPNHYAETVLKNVIPHVITSSNAYPYREKQWSYYDTRHDIDNVYLNNPNIVLHGYWQSEQHFPNLEPSLIAIIPNDLSKIFPFLTPTRV